MGVAATYRKMSMHSLSIEGKGPLLCQSDVCQLVLRALPEWFPIESSTLSYIESAKTLPAFVAYVTGEPVGIVLVKRHFGGATDPRRLEVALRSHGAPQRLLWIKVRARSS